jgi:hypothetical protein
MRSARFEVSRFAPQFRYADGGGRNSAADAPGVDGTPRLKTTLIYADYMPSDHEAELVERAFGHQTVIKASASGGSSE